MLPFGGFFLKLIGGAILQGVISGQVNKVTYDPAGQPVVEQKHWLKSKGIWGALAVIGYVGISIYTGMPIDIANINSIIENGGNIFLVLASIFSIIGRVKA